MADVQGAYEFYQKRAIGLAEGIVHRGLIPKEKTLKRAIPVLITIFLLVTALGITLFLTNSYHKTLARAKTDIVRISGLIEASLSKRLAPTTEGTAIPLMPAQSDLAQSLPLGATAYGRIILITDGNGRVRASAPITALHKGKRLVEILGPNQPVTTLGRQAGVQLVIMPDGEAVLAAMHNIGRHPGQIAILQPRMAALADWRGDLTGFATLFSLAGLTLALMTGAFFWQTGRTAEAEDTLKATQARLNKALLRGHCGLWDWDLARGQVYWSSSMFDILGLKPQTRILSFGEINSLAHPDDPDLYELAEKLAKGKSSSVDTEFRMRHADGHWVWLRARAETSQSDNDIGPHLVGILVDITDQKLQAEITEQSDMRLSDAIENISETFVLWDNNNRLVMCNGKYMQFYNLKPEEAKPGMRYHDVMANAREPSVSNCIEAGGCGKNKASYEVQLEDGRWLHINERRTSDGSFVSIGTDVTPLKDHERRLIGTVKDLKQSERALEVQTQKLAELAESLTCEKTRAETANRSKSEFLANMSHELRTPLNAIIGFSEMMKSGMFGPLGAEKYDEYASDINESGQYLLEVIDDILDMSKIEAGRFDIAMEDHDIRDMIEDSLKIIHPRACEDNIHIINKIEAGHIACCDKRAVKQVLLNLMSNALKFTDPGGRVRISLGQDGDVMRLCISDTGIGIPESEIKRLGRPFALVEDHDTKSHCGTGLGLAISRSLVEMQQGQLEIESEVGVGTKVFFTLPKPLPA